MSCISIETFLYNRYLNKIVLAVVQERRSVLVRYTRTNIKSGLVQIAY